MQKPIYIYHCSTDNTPTDSCPIRWISTFARFMQPMIADMRGEEIKIKLIDENIGADLSTADILIILLSPNFIRCKKNLIQLAEISDLFGLTEEGNVNTLKKVYKVIKKPVAVNEMPKNLRKLLPYSFHNAALENEETTDIRSIDQFFTPRAEKTFWLALIDLCYDISEARMIHEKVLEQGSSKYIYLANTGADLASERLKIKRELQSHGFKVMPEKYPPTREKEFEQQILNDLRNCEMSVHLLGEEYGETISASEEFSFSELENKYAAKFSREYLTKNNRIFPRLVWMSHSADYTDEKQKFFIDTLSSGTEELLFGAEIIQSKIEDFKSTLLYQLKIKNTQQQTSYSILDNTYKKTPEKKIYLINDHRDVHNISALEKWLKEQNFMVMNSWQKYDSKKSRMLHQEYLKTCDAAIIYFQHAKKDWVFAKLQDVLKVNGMGRKKRLTISGIYTKNKENYEWIKILKSEYQIYRNTLIMYNNSHSVAKTMREFVSRVAALSDKH